MCSVCHHYLHYPAFTLRSYAGIHGARAGSWEVMTTKMSGLPPLFQHGMQRNRGECHRAGFLVKGEHVDRTTAAEARGSVKLRLCRAPPSLPVR